jgi:aldehyde:ferredoxin oxidoreductase
MTIKKNKYGGYAGKILFVDLSTKQAREEILEEKLCRDFIGGYGIGAKIIFDRQKVSVGPLEPENHLGFVTGPLTGTATLFGSRYMVVGKSPLTGTWGDANSGGDFGPHLKFAGFDAIFFSGASEKPVYLFLQNGKAEIRDAGHLWGKDTNETEDMLQKELGGQVRVACIGPAGEKLSLISAIINNQGRAAARSGLGALMGSKKLKAVVAGGSMRVHLADEAKVDQLRRKYLPMLKGPLYDMLKEFGTPGQLETFVKIGMAPVKNWAGIGEIDFPNAKAISDVNVRRLRERKYACYRCPIACGGVMRAGKEYGYKQGAHQPEYETLSSFGSMCLNTNLESIIMANDICNRYGLDTISTGATIAFAIECYERGLITTKETDGIELTWGNHEAIVNMTEKMAKRESFGLVLADGVKRAAERIGKGSEEFAFNVCGQELPNADPKLAPSFGTTYITAATPARHMKGGAQFAELGKIPNGADFPALERHVYTGKGEIHAWMRKYYHTMDAMGLCLFGSRGFSVEALLAQFNAATGIDFTKDELLLAGERIACVCQAFNVREGIKPSDFRLSSRVIGNPPFQQGPHVRISVDIDNMAREFYKAMEWDFVTGKPSKRRLEKLGLREVIRELWP